MAIDFGHNINLQKNQLLNAGFQIEPTHPSSPFAGQIYYNSTDGRFYGYSGTASKWRAMDDSDAIGSITAQEIVDMINNSGYVINGLNIDLGGAIHGAAGKASIINADTLVISDSSDTNKAKKVSVEEFKSVLKTYFDTLYNMYSHPNHSGDVTSTGDGATTIANKAVSLAKMADLTKQTIIGRKESTAGVPQALTASDVRTLINVADGANNYVHPNHSGDVTSVGGGATTISNKAVSLAKMADLTTKTLIGRKETTDGVPQALTASEVRTLLNVADGANKYTHPNHSGDVTSTGDGATVISNKAVSLTKMADLAAKTFIGNDGNVAATPKALSATDARALLNVTDGATKVEAGTNGSIKINGTATTVYTHPGSGTNPHGTTASDIGLGSVTNNAQIKKRSSSTVGYVPTWDATSGDSLGAGYSVETTLTGGAGALPRADAVKTYIDSLLGANDAMIYKGVIDASTNPNYPAADAGHTYKISKAGKIGGASGLVVEIGDMIICTTDATAAGTQEAVGANWNILQANIDGTVTGPTSAVNNNFVSFNGTTGKLIKDSGKKAADFASSTHNHDAVYLKKYAANLTASATQTVTHNLNTEDITVTVRRSAGDKAIIFTDVKITGVNTISIAFATAPAANEYRVIITG